VPGRLISDHPVWLSDTTNTPAVALPDEPVEALTQLANDVAAPMVVVIDGRGRYPAALRSAEGRVCFDERSLGSEAPPGAAIFVLRSECRP
jgi:hypothetical protein